MNPRRPVQVFLDDPGVTQISLLAERIIPVAFSSMYLYHSPLYE
jgi:hypothetical protein